MNKTARTILLILLALVLVVGGVLVGINWGRWFGDKPPVAQAPTPSPKPKLEVDPNAGVYVPPEPTPQPDSGGIAIPGWGSITLPANQTEVTVDFPNPEANEGRYYLSFALRLKETGEELYVSGLVPPGQTIQTITLSRPLEAGSYPAVVHVQPYKMDEAQTPTNNADMETELIVK